MVRLNAWVGDIFVVSEPDKGTTFIIYLPKADTLPIIPEHLEKQKDLPQGNGEHILVVDDEVSIARVQKRLLERYGYTVTALNDSIEALECFKTSPDEFHAVLTDMTMPGMTGKELIQAIRKIQPQTPVILCTGFSHHLTKAALKKNNIHFYCNKPILQEELLHTVRQALDSRST